MPVINIQTIINAPIERCFLLAASIDLHIQSASKTKEEAVGGVTSGTVKLNDTITWQAKHFGITYCLTSKITDYQPPFCFTDEMQEGPFKKLRHQHLFKKGDAGAIMTDIFEFEDSFWDSRVAGRTPFSNKLHAEIFN